MPVFSSRHPADPGSGLKSQHEDITMTTEDSGIPAATAEDHPDAEIVALEEERLRLYAIYEAADIPGGDPAPELDDHDALVMRMFRTPSKSPLGLAMKLRHLRRQSHDGDLEAELIEALAQDAAQLSDLDLILWEQEYFRLWNDDYKSETEAGQEALDRAAVAWSAIDDKVIGTQAHTLAGLAVKVRMIRHSLCQGTNPEKDNHAWDTIQASLEEIGGAS